MTINKKDFQSVYSEAFNIGLEAGITVNVTPMHLVGYKPVEDGVCGFAWIIVWPGNSSFAKYLLLHDLAQVSYYGGVRISMSAFFNQSYIRKMAMATAMAKYLQEKGINAIADGQLD